MTILCARASTINTRPPPQYSAWHITLVAAEAEYAVTPPLPVGENDASKFGKVTESYTGSTIPPKPV